MYKAVSTILLELACHLTSLGFSFAIKGGD